MDTKEELYLVFKACLLIDGKSVKDFADEHTGTTPQHVTMVAKQEKESDAVKQKIYSYIDRITGEKNTQKILTKMVEHGQAVNDGRPTERRIKPRRDGEEYDW